MHPKINDIIDFIQQAKLGIIMETNGTLCTQAIAEKIAKCRNRSVSVSIDGAAVQTHEWIRGVKGSFDKAWKGVENLIRAGVNTQIIMTIMRKNISEMESLLCRAEEYGCRSIKFNIVQPAARGKEMHEKGETLSIEELIKTGEWVEGTLSKKTKLHLFYSHPMAFRPLSSIFGDEKTGCSVCGILGIMGVLASGLYALCGIGETIPDLVFGDAHKDKLEDVWNNDHIINEIRQGLSKKHEGICGECIMLPRCRGSCIAQNYYSTKSLWSGFWYCEAANRKGLFPYTRRKLTKQFMLS